MSKNHIRTKPAEVVTSSSGIATAMLCAAGLSVAAGVIALRKRARSKREIKLKEKTVVITGGSRGLGLILARRLASCEARVCIIARDESELTAARESILSESRASVPEVYAISADIADREEIQNALRAAESLFRSPIDVLINNAGVIRVGPMDVMTHSDYEKALDVHFWAPYHAIQEILPAMRTRRFGRIVNIASIGGKISVPHLLPYSTSKFALVGFSEGLRAELIKDNVFVTTVCPGLIRTGSPRNATFKGRHRDEYTWFALGDSLPGISMSAERCADQIIGALRFGDAEVITSLLGQVGAIIHGIAPSFVVDILGEVNRLLPDSGEAGSNAEFSGAESETRLTQSFLSGLTRRAERDNNQIGDQSSKPPR